MQVRVYEFAHGNGVRIVFGEHVASADSGVPTAIRDYDNVKQAYAAEGGNVRELLLMYALSAPPAIARVLRSAA